MSEPKDLSGDPVYDYLKKFIKKDQELIGGVILDKKVCRPSEPRKILQMVVKDLKTGRKHGFLFNYKKLERKLKHWPTTGQETLETKPT
jgi:hypothetical protein